MASEDLKRALRQMRGEEPDPTPEENDRKAPKPARHPGTGADGAAGDDDR